MTTKKQNGMKTVVTGIAILVLLAILFTVTWRTTHSVLVVALVAAWCVLFIIVPTVLLKRSIRSGSLDPPRRRLMVLSWAGLAAYALFLAVFEFATGAGPASWGLTLIATLGFLGASLSARREFA